MSNERSVKRLFSHVRKAYGRLDVLINSAGIGAMNHSLLTPVSTIRDQMSMVRPPPLPFGAIAQYGQQAWQPVTVKPGIIGPAPLSETQVLETDVLLIMQHIRN